MQALVQAALRRVGSQGEEQGRRLLKAGRWKEAEEELDEDDESPAGAAFFFASCLITCFIDFGIFLGFSSFGFTAAAFIALGLAFGFAAGALEGLADIFDGMLFAFALALFVMLKLMIMRTK